MRLAASAALALAVLIAASPARTQTPSKLPHVAYLWLGPEGSDRATTLSGWQQGLRELGYQEGRNIVIEYRYADGNTDRLRELIADTVAGNVAVIVAPGQIVADAVKRATTTIPVVAVTGDMLASGLVASLARPGGNITGFSFIVSELGAKWVELLHEMVPRAVQVAMLWNPVNPASRVLVQATREGADRLGLTLQLHEAQRQADLPLAFAAIAKQNPDAFIIDTDAILLSYRKSIIEFAAAHRLPDIYGLREFAEDGGLLSYGPSPFDIWRRVAGYVDKILKGAQPADLPVQEPTKFELVVNLKTAKALGLTIPPLILSRVDEAIE